MATRKLRISGKTTIEAADTKGPPCPQHRKPMTYNPLVNAFLCGVDGCRFRAFARDKPTLIEPLIVEAPELRVQELNGRLYLMSSEDPTVFLALPMGSEFYVEDGADATKYTFEVPVGIRPGKAAFGG